MRNALIVCTAILLLSVENARADLIVQVGNGDATGSAPQTVVQGEVISLGVTLERMGNAFDLKGFDLAFELSVLGAPGPGLPAGTGSIEASSYTSPFSQNQLTDFFLANDFVANGLTPNFDFTVTANAPNGQSNPLAAPLTLFTVDINTSSMAVGTIYSLSFVPTAQADGMNLPGFSVFSGAGDPGSLAASPGSFRVTAVPEPGSLALLTGLGCLVGLRRRRLTV